MEILGHVSGHYESGNRADAVSTGTGDLGGVSYGAHQFIAPVANAFARWLQEQGSSYGGMLSEYNAGSQSFSNMWRQIASMDNAGFLDLQHQYTQMQYYDLAAELLKKENYNLEKHSLAMKEAVFSRAVQYGAGNVCELFSEGLHRLSPAYLNLSYVDDRQFDAGMIASVYNFLIEECDNAYQLESGLYHSPKDWANGSYTVVKIGLRNRFINERDDLLELLASEV